MTSSLIMTTTDETARSLMAAGQPVRAAAAQLRHHVERVLGPEHAALLAEPVYDPAALSIDWYGPGAGTAVPLDQLDPAARHAAAARARTLLQDILAEAGRLGRSEDPGQRVLGDMLMAAGRVPDPGFLRVRGDTPVMVAWGHTVGGESVELIDLLKLIEAPAPPPPPPVSELPPVLPPALPPVLPPPRPPREPWFRWWFRRPRRDQYVALTTRRSSFWPALLVFLLAAAATFALTTLLAPDAVRPYLAMAGLQDPGTESELREALAQARQTLARRAADCAAPPSEAPPGHGAAPPAPATQPADRGPSPAPQPPPPTPPAAKPVPAPPSPTPPPQPAPDHAGEPGPFDAKTLAKRDVGMFRGCWKRYSSMSTYDVETGAPHSVADWQTCFDQPDPTGQTIPGHQTITYSDGHSCSGPIAGRFLPDGRFEIADTEICAGSQPLLPATYSCTRRDDSTLVCDFVTKTPKGDHSGSGVELRPAK